MLALYKSDYYFCPSLCNSWR